MHAKLKQNLKGTNSRNRKNLQILTSQARPTTVQSTVGKKGWVGKQMLVPKNTRKGKNGSHSPEARGHARASSVIVESDGRTTDITPKNRLFGNAMSELNSKKMSVKNTNSPAAIRDSVISSLKQPGPTDDVRLKGMVQHALKNWHYKKEMTKKEVQIYEKAIKEQAAMRNGNLKPQKRYSRNEKSKTASHNRATTQIMASQGEFSKFLQGEITTVDKNNIMRSQTHKYNLQLQRTQTEQDKRKRSKDLNEKRKASITGQLPASQLERVDQLRDKDRKMLDRVDNKFDQKLTKLVISGEKKAAKREKRAQTALAQRKQTRNKVERTFSNKDSFIGFRPNDPRPDLVLIPSQHKNSSLRELDGIIAEKPSSFYDSEPLIEADVINTRTQDKRSPALNDANMEPNIGDSDHNNFNSSVEWQMNRHQIRPLNGRSRGNRLVEEAKQERAHKFFNQFVELTQQIDESDMTNLLQALKIMKDKREQQVVSESPKLINIDSKKQIVQQVDRQGAELQPLSLTQNLEYDPIEPPLTEMDKSPHPEDVINLMDEGQTSPEHYGQNYPAQQNEGPMVDLDQQDHLDTVHVQNDESQRSWPYDVNEKSKTQTQSIQQDYVETKQFNQVDANQLKVTPQFDGHKAKMIEVKEIWQGKQANPESEMRNDYTQGDEFEKRASNQLSGLDSHTSNQSQVTVPAEHRLILNDSQSKQGEQLSQNEHRTGGFNETSGRDKGSKSIRSIGPADQLKMPQSIHIATDDFNEHGQSFFRQQDEKQNKSSELELEVNDFNGLVTNLLSQSGGKQAFTVSTYAENVFEQKYSYQKGRKDQNESFALEGQKDLRLKDIKRKETWKALVPAITVANQVQPSPQISQTNSTPQVKMPNLKAKLQKKSPHVSDIDDTPKRQSPIVNGLELEASVMFEPHIHSVLDLVEFDDLDVPDLLRPTGFELVHKKQSKALKQLIDDTESTGSFQSGNVLDQDYWGLMVMDKFAQDAAEFDMFAFGMEKEPAMAEFVNKLPKRIERMEYHIKALVHFENIMSYNDLVLAGQVLTLCFMNIRDPTRVEAMKTPLTLFDLKTACGHQGIFYDVNWEALQHSNQAFAVQVKKHGVSQRFESQLTNLIAEFVQIYDGLHDEDTQKCLKVPIEVLNAIHHMVFVYMSRMIPIQFYYKVPMCSKQIMDDLNQNEVPTNFDILLETMDFKNRLDQIENHTEMVENLCFQQKVCYNFFETWAETALKKRSLRAQINSILFSFTIHEASKQLYNQPDDLLYRCNIHKLHQFFSERDKSYIVSLKPQIFDFPEEEKNIIYDVKRGRNRPKSPDPNDPSQNRQHHATNHIQLNEALMEDIVEHYSDDEAQPDREFRYMGLYRRNDAFDVNRTERHNFHQQLQVEAQMTHLRDCCQVMYNDLRMIINQDDQATTDVQKMFAYKCKMVRDFSNGNKLFELMQPCEQAKTQRKLDLQELRNLKFIEKDMRLNENQTRRSIFLETVAFMGNKYNSESGFPFKSNSPLLERLKAKRTRRNLIRNQSKQCWHVLSQMGGTARNYAMTMMAEHNKVHHNNFYDESQKLMNTEAKWKKHLPQEGSDDGFETDDSMKVLNMADFASDPGSDDENKKQQDDLEDTQGKEARDYIDKQTKKRNKRAKTKASLTLTPYERYKRMNLKNNKVDQKTLATVYYSATYVEPNDLGYEKKGNFYDQIRNKVKVDKIVENLENGAFNDNMKQYDKLNQELHFLRRIRAFALEKFETEEEYLASKEGNMMEVNLRKAEDRVSRQMVAMRNNFNSRFEDKTDKNMTRRLTQQFNELLQNSESPAFALPTYEEQFSEVSDMNTETPQEVNQEEFSDAIPDSHRDETQSNCCSGLNEELDVISLGPDQVSKKLTSKSVVKHSRRGTILRTGTGIVRDVFK